MDRKNLQLRRMDSLLRDNRLAILFSGLALLISAEGKPPRGDPPQGHALSADMKMS